MLRRTAWFVCLSYCSSSLSVAEPLRLNTVSNDYPPFYSAMLENKGVVFDMVQQAFQQGGYEIEHQFFPFVRATTLIKNGHAQGIIGVWYRPEREQWIAFSKPLLSVNIVLYKRSNSRIKFEQMSDLKGYRIGIGRGYANPQRFSQAKLKTEEASSDKENLKKLLLGRVDLVLISDDVAKYLISLPGSEFEGQFEVLGEPLSVERFHIGIAKTYGKHQQVITAFNQGLDTMVNNGELAVLLQTHGFESNDYWVEQFAAQSSDTIDLDVKE
ncbi:substrate-binding periplasmic protein [Shewanella colwelliana]|uniref:substrate-binding periplasmic protein n=1 Tax=Shewanella colwelliana TaxID=23 RepID=UPI001C7DF703|nr:transporter substrate-binding domain-containing protein [Shewanella colwelliana]